LLLLLPLLLLLLKHSQLPGTYSLWVVLA